LMMQGEDTALQGDVGLHSALISGTTAGLS
jgi:hypothetical protein